MLKLCLIFGGVSNEHEISLRSMSGVVQNLDRRRYEIIMLGITKNGQWLHYSGPANLIENGMWEYSPFVRPAAFNLNHTKPGLILLGSERLCASAALRRRILGEVRAKRKAQGFIPVDAAFPVLHGKDGEDGTVQGLLELAGIPYVGCGVLSSALCMDKEFSHIVLQSAGIPKTKLIAMHRHEMDNFKIKAPQLRKELGYPMFVKPANSGSSVGISKVSNRAELQIALEEAFRHDCKAVVEKALKGTEVECAVLGNDVVLASDYLAEIAPSREFYDYTAKYLDDSTELIIPARISDESARQVKEIAVKAYRALGCKGMARVDFFVRPGGSVVLNEVNTIPGFTTISMYPRMFIQHGITYSELLDRLIKLALEV